MVYTSLSGYVVIDMETGQYVRGLSEADTDTGRLVFYKTNGNIWERTRVGGFLKRKIETKICAFDVVDPRSGAVVDKARP
jgi:hypothetical protein